MSNRKRADPPKFDTIAICQRLGDVIKHRANDPLDILPINMWVPKGDDVDEL